MPLMDCPKCGHQVSDRVATCPNCEAGIHTTREREGAGRQGASVQNVDNRPDIQSVLSGALIGIGLILVFVGVIEPEAAGWGFTFGWLPLGAGLVWLIVARSRIRRHRE